MNLLPFNADISRRMHVKPYNFLVALPGVFGLAAIGPFVFLIGPWLDEFFPASSSQSTLERVPGACVFGFALLIFMLSGILLGWLFNAWILRIFYKWPSKKLRQTFLHSQVPEGWLKDKTPSDTKFNWSDRIKAFQSFRHSGTSRQNFIFLGLLSGLGMFLAVALLPVLDGTVEGTAFYFFWQTCLWTTVGVLFGLAISLLDEKIFRK